MKKYEEMFIKIVELTAEQSNCVKYNVGCIAVRDNRIISQGYNGTISGFTNCKDKFHGINMDLPINRDIHNKWSSAFEVHAEMNVLTHAAKEGISLKDTTLYVTHHPCNNCMKHIIASGVKEVIYINDYQDNNIQDDIKQLTNLIKIRKYERI